MVNIELDTADADELITRLHQRGHPWYVPVVRAVAGGRIDLIEPQRTTSRQELRRTLRRAATAGRPTIVLIGDDDYATTGPSGWPGVASLLRWAALTVVHGSGGTAEDYQWFVELAEARTRLLLIETTSEAAPMWAAAAPAGSPMRVWVLLPTDGPHPVARVLQ